MITKIYILPMYIYNWLDVILPNVIPAKLKFLVHDMYVDYDYCCSYRSLSTYVGHASMNVNKRLNALSVSHVL